MIRSMLALVVFAGASGCVASRGTGPHEMSAGEHLAASLTEEEAAVAARAGYDPGAWRQRGCPPIVRGQLLQPCWSSTANPTAWFLEEERFHRELAATHRASSQALREAEASACAGFSDRDRDESPFLHREDILEVRSLQLPREPSRAEEPGLLGALVVFGPVPGLGAEALQRLVDCHMARNAALGHDRPEVAFCPLALRDVQASVQPTGGNLAVTITSQDRSTAGEILRRAQALAPSRPAR